MAVASLVRVRSSFGLDAHVMEVEFVAASQGESVSIGKPIALTNFEIVGDQVASQVEHEVTVQEMIVLPDTRATVRVEKDRCYSLRTASGPGGVEIKVRNAHETNGASLSLPLRIRPGAEISFCSPLIPTHFSPDR